jgi:hypothetical protein
MGGVDPVPAPVGVSLSGSRSPLRAVDWRTVAFFLVAPVLAVPAVIVTVPLGVLVGAPPLWAAALLAVIGAVLGRRGTASSTGAVATLLPAVAALGGVFVALCLLGAHSREVGGFLAGLAAWLLLLIPALFAVGRGRSLLATGLALAAGWAAVTVAVWVELAASWAPRSHAALWFLLTITPDGAIPAGADPDGQDAGFTILDVLSGFPEMVLAVTGFVVAYQLAAHRRRSSAVGASSLV